MLIFDLVIATRSPAMTGVERYGVNLFEAVRAIRPDTMAFVRDADSFRDRSGLLPVKEVYSGWLGLPLALRRHGLSPEAAIFPTAPAAPSFLNSRTPLCRIIHDAFPWTRAQAMPLKGRLLYRNVENLMARRYDLLMSTTEPVAQDLRAALDRLDIEACGNAPGFDLAGPERRPPGAPTSFILLVGTVEPRKNYARLIELLKRRPEGAPPILLVGRPGWGDIVKTIENLAAEQPTKFIWLHNLTDDAQLLWLHRRANCFLSMSEAEGFNMPLVESGLCGRPILCSDIAIHRAVAPPWARFIAPDADADSIWRDLAAAAPPTPAEQADYGRLYSWRRVAARLLDLVSQARPR